MITSAFICTGLYAALVMLGIKRVENRDMMPVPARSVGVPLFDHLILGKDSKFVNISHAKDAKQ